MRAIGAACSRWAGAMVSGLEITHPWRNARPDTSRGQLAFCRFAEQELDHDDVAPLAVELSMPMVQADLTEAEAAAERQARFVLGEDPADQLPEARDCASRTSASTAKRPRP
jgi:hypothetical protein